MTNEDAKAIFLLEYCGERCGDYADTSLYVCEECEIKKAIEALDAVRRVETAITQLEEQTYRRLWRKFRTISICIKKQE